MTQKTPPGSEPPDDIDRIQEEWAQIRPDLPLRSIGVITRIWRIAKLLSEDRRRTMNQLGMEPAIRDLLANLRRSGEPYRLRVSELAVRCRVSKSAITQRVARAEADGLVRSTRTASADSAKDAAEDQRAVWIELTARGKDLVDSTVESLLHHEDALVDELSQDEIDSLSNVLRRLLRTLEER